MYFELILFTDEFAADGGMNAYFYVGGRRAADGKFYYDPVGQNGEVFDATYWVKDVNINHGTPGGLNVECLRAQASSTNDRFDVKAFSCNKP